MEPFKYMEMAADTAEPEETCEDLFNNCLAPHGHQLASDLNDADAAEKRCENAGGDPKVCSAIKDALKKLAWRKFNAARDMCRAAYYACLIGG